MSILADLLSKKNNAEPSGGKVIPPTLSRSHDMPTKVRNPNNRYIVISAISVATIALGALAMLQFKHLPKYISNKPAQAPQPAAPVTPPPVAAVPNVESTQPGSPQVIEPEKPPVPVNHKQTSVKNTSKKTRNMRRFSAQKAAPNKMAANQTELKNIQAASVLPVTSASTVKIDTGKRDALLYAARSAEQASDWRLALANYRKAQKLDPDNYIIMNNIAAAHNNLGMFDDGVREARRALGKKPDYVPAMVNAAIANSSKGNSQEALRLFSEASIADPGNRSLVINLGILQERAGRLDDAQMTYRPFADDGDPLALQGMGRVYERKGNKGEAVRIYRQIMALPSASPAQKKEIKGKLARLEE